MSSRRNSLSPPERTHTEDPGAHDLKPQNTADSESDDHFSDAHSLPAESSRASPIPRTRVEKISDEPSYGEVPGTDAYRLREGDAEPDEIAMIADADGGASDGLATTHLPDRPSTPGGKPIPTTLVEETPDGDGAKTPDGKKHESDPVPDLVVKADGTLNFAGNTALNSSDSSSPQEPRSTGTAAAADTAEDAEEDGGDENEDDGFGDDFDEFEEGGGDDEDFGEFDDGFQEPPPAAAAPPLPTQAPAQPAQSAPPALPFPIPDFEELDADDILKTTAPYLNGLFQPDDSLPTPPQLSNSVFLTPRSASLWSQLVAPPPLQPPDWIRSRIRRLFLVSLGVPVDLDEILPASKQKKLILPSLSVRRTDSPRTSSDSRSNTGAKDGSSAAANNSVARLKQSGANGSNSSVDSQGKPSSSSRKRKGPPPPPDLDLVAGQQLCRTTDEALDGMTDDELRAHAQRLASLEVAANEVLEYWTKRTDEKIGDREAFEGVIESLVAHARKTRK
ncbi:uncharacterized protein SPSK_06127 [Sporothrix schenckii 1099-18]|uniref:Uncharacterized protein n=1 Tax=Sporothrix schenckii 1099-18 TaxID=1397361 RepID=A0A0F2MMS0_SPOSC|nr:uncharacterized protein SPSK_06127 [Sporothrix schenckii 1099-18]KJR89466.1 hypothetical protein SPSK_06127 [Sporothrix schenckii 1099-18]